MPDLQKQLTVRPGRDATPTGDLTSVSDFDRTELTSMASAGESGVSTWVLRNEDGTLPDRRLSVAKYLGPHNVVTVIVGSNTLFRGRISAADVTKGVQRGTRPQEQSYTLSDYNDDLRGIVVHDWERPEETDAARVQGLVARYLSGHPRESTNLNGSNHVVTGSNTTTLPAKTYSAMSPMEVLQELATSTDKEMFVDVDGNLHYHDHEYAGFDSPLRISDDLADLNSTTCVPIEPSASEEGRDQISGIRSYWGDEQDRSVVIEDEFFQNRTDYWVEPYFDDAADNATEAERNARAILANRAREEKTYIVTVGKPGTIPTTGNPMTGDDIYKLKAGQRIQFKSRAVRGGLAVGGGFYGDSFLTCRIRSVTWTMPTADAYYARLELERPRRVTGLGHGRRQPKSTAAKPPPDCIPVSEDDVTVLSDSTNDPSDWPGTDVTTGSCWGGDHHMQMGASGGSSSQITVSAGDVIRGSLEFREETGNDAWENVANYNYKAYLEFERDTPGLPVVQHLIVNQRYHNVGCINVTHEATATVPAGYNRARVHIIGRLGGYRYIGTISEVDDSSDVPDNDEFCVPPGSGGESPFFARSDDPRFTNDDQHLITKIQQRVINNSGSTLQVGDIVVADTTQDDPSVTFATAASASDEGMVGIVTTAMGDNETGVVMWQGNFLLPINDGSSTPAPGDYIFTSATDGAADFDAARAEGAVGQVIATDSSDNTTFILWWGNPDQAAAGGGGGNPVVYDIERYTGGDITVTATTAGADFPTLSDVVVPAAAGDLVMIGMSARCETTNTGSFRWDVKFITGSTENYLSSETTTPSAQGVSGWFWVANSVNAKSGGEQPYVVQAADISGGNLTCSLRAWLSSGGSWQVAADSDAPLKFWVRNLGQ